MSKPVPPSADLIAVIPPATSAWSLFGVQDLVAPFIQVRNAQGNHALGWSLIGDTHVLRIKFTLYQQDAFGISPVKEMAMPARPTFSIFHQMTRRFLGDEKRNVASSCNDFAPVAGNLAAHNDAMHDQHDQFHELLQDWFEDSPALALLAGNLYIALSTDITMQLSEPGWKPPGRHRN